MDGALRHTLGLAARPRAPLLVERARDLLAAGPLDAATLIAHVCAQARTPALIAEHMAMALLGEWPEFSRGADGLWRHAAASGAGAAPDSGDNSLFVHPAGTSAPARDRDRLDRLSYVVVDVETTGGQAERGDRITEIAAVVVRGGEIVEVFEALVNPQRAIPPFITRLTNISWEMVRDQPTFAELCENVVRVMQGHVFVAHNAAFDWRFVCAEVARSSGATLEGRRLCTVRLARKLLPQLPRRSLDWVARHYGVDITARHRAAGDAVATAHVLQGLLRDAADHGVETWSQLDRFLSAPSATARRRRPRGRSGMPGPVDRDTTA